MLCIVLVGVYCEMWVWCELMVCVNIGNLLFDVWFDCLFVDFGLFMM